MMVLIVGLLTACSEGADQAGTRMTGDVTVTIGTTTAELQQQMACWVDDAGDALNCAAVSGTAPEVALTPGTALDVDVSDRVGNAPWVLVFQYLDDSGDAQNGRTSVFPAGERFSYRLVPPPHAQLTRLEVQTLTVAPTDDGGVDFPATGSWAINFNAPASLAMEK